MSSVGIYFTLGSNGILNKAKEAKNETLKQAATEKMNLKITNIQIETYGEEQRMPTLQEFSDGLCEDDEIQYVELQSKKVGSLEKINVGNARSIFTKLKEYPYEFEINSSLQLASIDGIKVAATPTENPKVNDNYSTEEQAVGTWIDGKTIYRKVVSFSENVSSYENVRFISKTVVTGVDATIDCGGYFILNNLKFSFGSSQTNWNVQPSISSYAVVSDNNLSIDILYYTGNYSDNPITGTVWLEYTKVDN